MRAFFVMMLCWVVPALALEVEVTGTAPVDGAMSYVREQAMKDALQQASLRAGVQINSTALMSQGHIEKDEVELKTSAQVRNVQVLEESQQDGLYSVTIRAEVGALRMCPTSKQHYRKAVAVAGFALAKPMQASLGHLQNIEQDLPRLLVDSLNNTGRVHALDASRMSLFQEPRQAPSVETAQQRLTTSVALATELGAQYVISGVVRDLSEAKPTGKWNAWREKLGLAPTSRPRQFVLDVFIHDGLSGAMLFQHSYSTFGAWSGEPVQQVGFASPSFWRMDYGQKVRTLVQTAVEEMDEALRCQPFMARIVKANGKDLHIEAGAGAGIRPGDKFQVYRTGTFYNLDLEPRTELTGTATEVVVKQVQPQFIIAEMKQGAERLAVQRDDMVVAW